MRQKIFNWEIYHKNFERLGEQIQKSGGDPFLVLNEYDDLLALLANNNIEIDSCTYHDPDLNKKEEAFQELESYQEKFKQ